MSTYPLHIFKNLSLYSSGVVVILIGPSLLINKFHKLISNVMNLGWILCFAQKKSKIEAR